MEYEKRKKLEEEKHKRVRIAQFRKGNLCGGIKKRLMKLLEI